MKNKIILVTFYSNNFGACLQAFALKNKIEEICDKSECVLMSSQDDIVALTDNEFSGLKASIKIFKSRVVTNIKSLLSKIFGRKYNMQAKEILDLRRYYKFRKNMLNLHKSEYYGKDAFNLSYDDVDAFVCGSDQIWNPVMLGEVNPINFLTFVRGGTKKIAYAASIGCSKLPEQYQADFINYIDDFDLITLRETHGQKIVKQLTGKDCSVVLDPSLLYGKQWWSQFANNRFTRKYSKNKPYIFCYIFNKYSLPVEIIESVEKLTGYNVIVVNPSKIMEERNWIFVKDAGPLEFVSLLKNSSYVITDSFHGIAFSINFNKPFYAFLRENKDNPYSMNSRIYSILDLFDLNDRLINSALNKLTDIDYSAVNLLLDKYRDKSERLLAGALNEDKLN